VLAVNVWLVLVLELQKHEAPTILTCTILHQSSCVKLAVLILLLAGVYYGIKLGRKVPWATGFPFSVAPHPQ
jgi:hypothetical protein